MATTQNNDGERYVITMDTAKEGAELWSLNDYFKARVGDNRTPLYFRWYTMGLLNQFTGTQKPCIRGKVGNFTIDNAKSGVDQIEMAPDAVSVSWTGSASDMMAGGLARYELPEQLFPKSGIFKGFIGYVDDANGEQRLSGVNVWFKVLDGFGDLGKDTGPYIAELEKILNNADEVMRQKGVDFDTKTNQALADLNTKYLQQVASTQAAEAQAKQSLQDLSIAAGNIQTQISAGNIVTRNQYDGDIKSIKMQIETASDVSTNNKQRLDSLTTPPAVTAGTEIADARIGAPSTGSNRYSNLGEAIRSQIDDLNISNEYIGIKSKHFSVAANTKHSSELDQLPFSVKKGDKYRVKLISDLSDPLAIELVEIGVDGSYYPQNIGAYTDKFYEYTAKTDTQKIGWYLESSDKAINLTAIVQKIGSLVDNVQENKINADKMNADTSFWDGDFVVSKGITHLSTKDMINVDIKQGERYRVKVLGNENDIFQVIENPSRDSAVIASTPTNDDTLKIYNFKNGNSNEFVASQDLLSLGIYIGDPSDNGTVKVLIEKIGYSHDKLTNLTQSFLKKFNVVKNSPLSSTYTGFSLTVPKGKKYIVSFSASAEAYVQIFEYDNYKGSGNKAFAFNSKTSGKTLLTANQDFNFLGIYLDTASPEAEIYIKVCIEGSIAYNLALADYYHEDALRAVDDLNPNYYGRDIKGIASVSERTLAEYTDGFADSLHTEQYVYFTDPHPMHFGGLDADGPKRVWLSLENYYNSTPTNFVMCGGDWLQSGQTTSDAAMTLGKIAGINASLFRDRFYTLIGNHDTNYQGVDNNWKGSVNHSTPGAVSRDTLHNIFIPNEPKAYYSFNGKSTTFYCLDSGIDWTTDMDNYRWEQIDWLAKKLIADDAPHSSIQIHIWWNDVPDGSPAPMASTVAQVIDAFNSRKQIELNNKTYDFGQVTGHIEFVQCGHLHLDRRGKVGGVPVIATTRTLDEDGNVAFELVNADYDNRFIQLTRVGYGQSRKFSLDTGEAL